MQQGCLFNDQVSHTKSASFILSNVVKESKDVSGKFDSRDCACYFGSFSIFCVVIYKVVLVFLF